MLLSKIYLTIFCTAEEIIFYIITLLRKFLKNYNLTKEILFCKSSLTP